MKTLCEVNCKITILKLNICWVQKRDELNSVEKLTPKLTVLADFRYLKQLTQKMLIRKE